MDLQTAANMLATLKDQLGGVGEIWLAGGEPTTHEALDDIIYVFGTMSPYVALITNGLNLADAGFAQWISEQPALKEVAVTLNSGNRYVHEVMVTQANAPFFEGLSVTEACESPVWQQIIDVYANFEFDKVIAGLANLARVGRPDLTIAINLNMSADANLLGLVDAIQLAGGRVDKVIFQVVNRWAGRARELAVDHPFLAWTAPTIDMVAEYFAQAKVLIASEKICEAICIYPLPAEIVETLGLDNEPIYQPVATPCISVFGEFRENVVSN
jgi:hypothetical protein